MRKPQKVGNILRLVLTFLSTECQNRKEDSHFTQFMNFIKYTPILYKRYYLFHYFSFMKSSENQFHFYTCILPDYERPKIFEKIAVLKI